MRGPSLRHNPVIGALAVALALCPAAQAAKGKGQRVKGEPRPEARTPNADSPTPNTQHPTPDTQHLLSLQILPASVALDGPRTEQALLLTGRYADGTEHDLTGSAKWSVGKPGIAGLDAEGFRLNPLKDGE